MTKQTEALIEIIDEQIGWIDGWEKAYPESVFSPVTEKESEALEQYKKHLGMRIAAQMARHIGKRFKEVIKTLQTCKDALEQPAQEPVGYIVPDYQNVMHARDGHTLMAQEKTDLHKIPVYTHPAPPAQEPVAWKHFDKAYSKACNSSQPQDWMDAALLAQQARNTHPAPQPAQEPVAWTSTKALQNAKLLGAGDLWLEFDENYAMDAKEIGSKSKQIPLYTHPAPVCKCGER